MIIISAQGRKALRDVRYARIKRSPKNPVTSCECTQFQNFIDLISNGTLFDKSSQLIFTRLLVYAVIGFEFIDSISVIKYLEMMYMCIYIYII